MSNNQQQREAVSQLRARFEVIESLFPDFFPNGNDLQSEMQPNYSTTHHQGNCPKYSSVFHSLMPDIFPPVDKHSTSENQQQKQFIDR